MSPRRSARLEAQTAARKLEPVIQAIRNDDHVALEQLLEAENFEPAWVNTAYEEKVPGSRAVRKVFALHEAISRAATRCVETLLRCTNIDANVASENGATPLHAALALLPQRWKSDVVREIVCLLVEHGADVHSVGAGIVTALHDACGCGDCPTDLIEPLCDEVVQQLRHDESYGMSWAFNIRRLRALVELSEKRGGEQSDNEVHHIVCNLVYCCGPYGLRIAFHFYRQFAIGCADVNRVLLERAVTAGYFDIVETLLEHNVPPVWMSECGRVSSDAVQNASSSVHQEMFDLMMRYVTPEQVELCNNSHRVGSDNHDTPIPVVVRNSQPTRLERLLQLGFCLPRPNRYRGMTSCTLHDDEKLMFMFAQPFSVIKLRICNFDGVLPDTILYHLDEDVLRILIKYGAPVDPPNSREMSAAVALALRHPDGGYATGSPLRSVLDLLLDNGADLNRKADANRFAAPDAVIAAAVVGNTPFLAAVFDLVVFDPIDVLTDLQRHLESTNLKPQSYVGPRGFQFQYRQLRACVGRSVHWLLEFVRKTSHVRATCESINRRTHNKIKARSGLHNSPWVEVWNRFHCVDRLENLSRFSVREQIRDARGSANVASAIDSTSLPCALKRFLQFEAFIEQEADKAIPNFEDF